MPIYSNFYQTLTTACPIVELRGYAAACGLKGHLYAYLDFNGPTGTARDGLAEGMLALAIEKKQLSPGQPIIEAASGPFATALTLASLTAGHPIVLVMPEDAPALRQEYLLRLGAQIRHSPARSGLAGARALAAQTAAANGWYYMNWLANDDNPEYHRRVTGPAILQSIAPQNKSLGQRRHGDRRRRDHQGMDERCAHRGGRALRKSGAGRRTYRPPRHPGYRLRHRAGKLQQLCGG